MRNKDVKIGKYGTFNVASKTQYTVDGMYRIQSCSNKDQSSEQTGGIKS